MNINSIVYCRISTQKQFYGYSLSQQDKICSDYCNNNNLIIITKIHEIGRSTNMNNLKKLVNILENNNNINIIISEATRLCRNINDFNNIINICLKNNITIYDIVNNIITLDMNNIIKLMNKIKQGEMESLILSKRVKRSILYRKSINQYLPAIPKFGYKFDYINNKKKLVKNEKEILIIKLINHLYHKKKYRHLMRIRRESKMLQ